MSPVKGREQRRLARIGKIHRGVKKQNAKGVEYPSAVNHFVVHEEDTTPEAAVEAFFEQYARCARCNDGEDVECNGVRALDVVFPTDDPTQWADEWYRMYGGALGLTCRGDGEKAHAKWDMATDGPRPEGVEKGTWATAKTKDWIPLTIPCPGSDCPMQQGDKAPCGITMNLQFLLPSVRGIGVWQTDLKGIHSINNIRDNVETIKAVTGGRIRGIPLTLSVRPKTVTPKGEKKKTVWVLDLSLPDVSLNDLLRRAQALPENMLMLPPPPDDQEQPEDEAEDEEVLAGETYEHGSTDEVQSRSQQRRVAVQKGEPMPTFENEARQPDAVENARPPAAPAKPPKTKPVAPYDAVKGAPKDNGPKASEVNSVFDLASYEPQNVGEVYTAAWTHFRMTRVRVDEIGASEIRDKKYGEAWRKVCSVKNAEQVAEPFA